MAYNLSKFQIDSIKIEAWQTHQTEEFLWNEKICADINCWVIDLTDMAYNLWKFQID